MNARDPKNKELQILIDDNFVVAKHCRTTMETISEVSLRYYFKKLSARRSQFAMELGQEIQPLGDKNPYIPSSSFARKWNDITEENKLKNVRKVLKLYKFSMRKYKKALSNINDGGCREILIRHKAHFATVIPELKTLRKLIKQKLEEASGTGSVV